MFSSSQKNIFVKIIPRWTTKAQKLLESGKKALWVGGVWRIPGSALLHCNHHQCSSLWSAWRCGRVFKAGNSTSLMLSNLKNRMPNIRFFPAFFSPSSPFLPEQTIQLCTVRHDPPCCRRGEQQCGEWEGFCCCREFFTGFFFSPSVCERHKMLWKCTDSSCQEWLFSQLPSCQFPTD